MSRSPSATSRPSPAPRSPAPGLGSPCCDSGRPVLTDPATGQTICSCQYPASLLAASSAYSRMAVAAAATAPPAPSAGLAASAESVYGHYAASAAQSLAQLGGDATTLYPTLVSLIHTRFSVNNQVKNLLDTIFCGRCQLHPELAESERTSRCSPSSSG